MPDVECEGTTFQRQQFVAGVLILLYNLVIPAVLFTGLAKAKASGRIDDFEYRQGRYQTSVIVRPSLGLS
jgi:hypothetical protein